MATRRIVHPSRRRALRHPKPRRRLFRRLVPYLAGAAGVAFLAAAATVLWWSKDLPDPQNISDRSVIQSTKIFDRTGTHLLYEIGDIRRTTVTLDDISPFVISTTLAAEDDQFYEHHGLDFQGIIRGVILKPLSGQRVQGGSTITQQLIKNSILTPERTIRRKVKEAVLALELEQRSSKDEILNMYLNEIPYGSQSYGIEAAAQTFFGKPARDVTLAEAAILAALPKAPTYYSPYGSRLEDLKQRQEHILGRLSDLGLATPAEVEAAKAEPLDFATRTESINAPHFVFYVKEQLDSEYGERVVEQGGLTVITTLDMQMQTLAEDILAEHRETLNNLGASNASLVAIDPKSGDILAMVGSIDYFDEDIDGNVNVSIRHRSPGSSIKPFVYTAAFQKGYTPDTVLIDAVTNFGQGYEPKNYDLAERGPVTMRTALANSINIPAVKTLYLAGVKQSTELAQAMGMSSLNDPDRYGLSLVLGGGEVRLLDEVSAYGVFANDGLRHPHRAMLKISRNNEDLFDVTTEELAGEQVITADLARLTTSILSDNGARSLTFGSRSPLQLGDRPVAAKTGTTQEFRDGWTMGFTPSLAVGVWTGNNDNSPMGKNSPGVSTAAPIWNDFMRQALSGTPIERFVAPPAPRDVPPGILRNEIPEVKGKWEAITSTLYTTDCPIALGEPITIKEIHNLLFYVVKDNPRRQPANAQNDPQFSRWKAGVSKWIAKQNEKNKDQPEEVRYTDSLPTPTCDASSSEDLPKVRIIKPDTTIVTSSPIAVAVEIDSPQPLREVRFLFDGDLIVTRGPDDPFIANLSFPAGFSGRKTMQVLAITENDLIGRAHRTFIINPDGSPPAVTLHTPQSGKVYKATSFPITAKITATDNNGIELVDVLYQKDGSSSTQRIGRTSTLAPTPANRYEVTWQDSPGPGTYEVYAVVYDITGNSTTTPRHTVIIE